MSDKTDEDDSLVDTVTFDYIKTSNFRSVRADGAIASTTPNGYLHLALYSERPAIPRRGVFALNDDGSLGDLVSMVSRESIVREMEIDLFLDLTTAEAIHRLLAGQIAELKAQGEDDDTDQS